MSGSIFSKIGKLLGGKFQGVGEQTGEQLGGIIDELTGKKAKPKKAIQPVGTMATSGGSNTMLVAVTVAAAIGVMFFVVRKR